MRAPKKGVARAEVSVARLSAWRESGLHWGTCGCGRRAGTNTVTCARLFTQDGRAGPDNLLERNPTTCRRGSVGYPYNRPSAAFSFDGGGSELLGSKTSNCQKSVHLVFKKYSMSINTQLPEHPELDEDPSAFDFRKVTAIEHCQLAKTSGSTRKKYFDSVQLHARWIYE